MIPVLGSQPAGDVGTLSFPIRLRRHAELLVLPIFHCFLKQHVEWHMPVPDCLFSKCNVIVMRGSVAEWLACWSQAQQDPGSNRSRDAVG